MDRRKNFLAFILLDALEDGNESDIYTILERSDGDVASYVLSERGIAPLHYACGMDNAKLATEVTKRFLEKGADANVRTDENVTPLHVAAMYGRVEIVSLLLQHGAQYDVYDEEHKTPVHYAIEEGHYEVVELMRDHIFLGKFEFKQQLCSLQQPQTRLDVPSQQSNTPNRNSEQSASSNLDNTPVNKVLLAVAQTEREAGDVSAKYTPNRIHYNYDVTSPYYINITHRRHRPQPVFPAINKLSFNDEHAINSASNNATDKTAAFDKAVEAINIFQLTKENLKELSQNTPSEHSRASLIDMWRQKVQKQRTHANDSQSMLKQLEEIDAIATHSMPQAPSSTNNIPPSPASNSGYLECEHINSDDYMQYLSSKSKNESCYMALSEAYVHTDDENGVVFYEKKMLTKQSAKQKYSVNSINAPTQGLNATITSQPINYTLPSDYETDALRAELTTFGAPPGPITKSTKRLYIKKLITCRRDAAYVEELNKKMDSEDAPKFSVELQRTVRYSESFQRIPEYMKYETQSALYFANHQQKRKMREGHLKQSFIYMLIDPRISCNLPGESEFLDKFIVWRRFLQSIFYVGKGKTSRPYSHLYDALKLHSRNIQTKAVTINGKQISIKKQTLDLELLKLPPKRSSENKKLDRILNIWGYRHGVVCLHVFHNIMPTDAYTREAAIIDALGLHHLTNVKRGDYYGPAQRWTMREKKYLGIALLYKAMQIFLAEGESQLSPNDLI